MAAGKPIIATNVGGTPEAIIDGETGILVPSKDIESMTSALVNMVDNPEYQVQLGTAGRKRAVQNYSVENYVSRLDDLYRQLLGIKTASTQIENVPNPQDSKI
jgi:glycosyltransferase involved in cell wall biosynthesis